MAFSIPTYETLRAAVIAYWRTIRSEVDVGPKSDVDADSRGMAHIGDGLHKHAVQLKKDLFPGTARDESQDNWLYMLGQPDGTGSYGRIQPASSSGTSALAVTSTGVATVTTTDYLQDTAGLRYAPTGTTNWVGASTQNISVEAIDTGYATNLETGDTLDFISPPANINQEATLVADLDGGRDLQTNTEGSAACLDYLRAPNISGNWPEWRRAIEDSSPGIFEGYGWPGRNNYPHGYGCHDYAACQVGETGTDRVITAAQTTIIDDYLADAFPELLIKQSRHLTVSTVEKLVEMEYSLVDGAPASYQCSWDAQAEQRYCVAGCDEPTKLIQVHAVYTTGPQSGETVLINGQEAVVDLEPGNAAAPVSSSMAKFTVTEWPWTGETLESDRPSGGGYYVLSGGGLILTVWTALRAYINSLGPARGPAAAPQAGWDDTIRIDGLKREAAIAATGYIENFDLVEIDGGVVDVGPSYDTTSAVQLMIDDDIAVYETK